MQEHLWRELKVSAIRWSWIDGIPLTFKFLGDVDVSRVSKIGGELERLAQCQTELDGRLGTMGFSRKSRPLMPHLTLGRFRDHASKSAQSAATLFLVFWQRYPK